MLDIRLSNFVEKIDVEEAVRIVKEAILSFAMDPITGRIDMDLITTGKSNSYRQLVKEVEAQIIDHLSRKQELTLVELAPVLSSKKVIQNLLKGYNDKIIREAIDGLAKEGRIRLTGQASATKMHKI